MPSWKSASFSKKFLAVVPPPPYTILKLGKNSGYTHPTLFMGLGEGSGLCELENARECKSVPRLLSMIVGQIRYSGTPPYDHPVYTTTSLLRPYSFKPNVKTIESFYYFDDPVNATTTLLRPGFYGPTVVALTGFNCTIITQA